MFTLEEKPLFWWPVTVLVPDPAKVGELAPQTFEMQFELLGRDASRDVLKPYSENGDHEAGNDELIKRVSKGWRGVVRPGGGDIPFNDETFAAAWQMPWFRKGVNDAYLEAVTGQKARQGN